MLYTYNYILATRNGDFRPFSKNLCDKVWSIIVSSSVVAIFEKEVVILFVNLKIH